MIEPTELVERIWERDPTVWTGRDEAQWLGWLDEPLRMRERVAELESLREGLEYERVVVAGMGGSSLAPLVLGEVFTAPLEVLDTTHPAAVRRVDPDGALFVVSSKSGTTLETRCHFEHLWELVRRRPERFVVVTDPGSALERLAGERGVRVVAGEPTVGGRYSALTPFGLVPAHLAGIEIGSILAAAERAIAACKQIAENPGLELGLVWGQQALDGRDKLAILAHPPVFGLWAEQLLAESTGKEGKGIVPAPGERPEGIDRQSAIVDAGPEQIGEAFFTWEFATAVAGALLGINPFDQPNVQEAKDRTEQVLSGQGRGQSPDLSVEDVLEQAKPGKYVAVQAFVDPAREGELQPLVDRARATGAVVTVGLGPRYLHSTGQLHKGGPASGLFVQVTDDPGEDVPIPGRKFGFARLIAAQAAGDYAALRERGRPVAQVRLEEL